MNQLYDRYARQTGSDSLDHADDVARIAAHLGRMLLPVLQERNPRWREARIFEFGAGWGRNLLALRKLGATHLKGIDISRDQVDTAHALGMSSIDWVPPGSVWQTTTPSEGIDLLLAIDVLEHLKHGDLAEFAAWAREAVSPGGLLVIQVPNALSPLNPVLSGDLTHLRGFTVSSIRQFAHMCGATLVHVEAVQFPTSGALRVFRDMLRLLLVSPALWLFSLILYGRNPDWTSPGPNLLAVAQMPERGRA